MFSHLKLWNAYLEAELVSAGSAQKEAFFQGSIFNLTLHQTLLKVCSLYITHTHTQNREREHLTVCLIRTLVDYPKSFKVAKKIQRHV